MRSSFIRRLVSVAVATVALLGPSACGADESPEWLSACSTDASPDCLQRAQRWLDDEPSVDLDALRKLRDSLDSSEISVQPVNNFRALSDCEGRRTEAGWCVPRLSAVALGFTCSPVPTSGGDIIGMLTRSKTARDAVTALETESGEEAAIEIGKSRLCDLVRRTEDELGRAANADELGVDQAELGDRQQLLVSEWDQLGGRMSSREREGVKKAIEQFIPASQEAYSTAEMRAMVRALRGLPFF